MTTYYQEFLGRFPIGAASKDFAVGVDALALTAGNYYLHGYTGESTAQLCEHMQAIIRTASSTDQSDATVAYSSSTARVTITLETAAALEFTDAALATILGYTSTSYSSATTFTAERKPRYVWRPTDPMMECDTQPLSPFAPVGTARVYRAQDGSMCSVDGVTVLYDCRTLAWQALPQADVLKNTSGADYRSLEEFWEDIIARGRPMRFYPDRTLNASTSYTTCVYGAEQPGSLADAASKTIAPYLGYWRVELPLWKVA